MLFAFIIFSYSFVKNIRKQSLNQRMKHFKWSLRKRVWVWFVKIDAGHFFEERYERIRIVLSIDNICDFVLFFKLLQYFIIALLLLLGQRSLYFRLVLNLRVIFVLFSWKNLNCFIKEGFLFGWELLPNLFNMWLVLVFQQVLKGVSVFRFEIKFYFN